MFKSIESKDDKIGYAVPVTVYVNAKSKSEATKITKVALSMMPVRVHEVHLVIQLTRNGEMFSSERI